jgi:hypothetical protein
MPRERWGWMSPRRSSIPERLRSRLKAAKLAIDMPAPFRYYDSSFIF